MCQALCICYLIYFQPPPCEAQTIALEGPYTCLLKHTSSNPSAYLLIRLIGPALRNAVWKHFFRIYYLYSNFLTHPLAGDLRKGAKPQMRSRLLQQKEKKLKNHKYVLFCSWFLFCCSQIGRS